ncbi:MAG: SDR family oxidoreductase [Deltaproteobacteria bacterium]|nr:SDR family oxidoreductase [Deltaproteobacteria bacterium]
MSIQSDQSVKQVLITGASGYVGGRLLHRLESRSDLHIRCLARRPESVHPNDPSRVEVVRGDLLEPESLDAALSGVDTAYFLVHALGSNRSFEKVERQSAVNFAAAAKRQGLKRVIYLGGLGHGDDLSSHLSTRHEVGQILTTNGVPTIELRASIILGSGSLSFELLRALTEKLPIMITPKWLKSLAQPIAIEDVLEYLIAALDRPFDRSRVFEIGGPDQVSYKGLIVEYAAQRSLRRWYVAAPVLSPYLSSLWLGLVTPVYARVGRKLIESLRNDTIVLDPSALQEFPIRPMDCKRAIARALLNEDREFAETRWSDSESSARSPQRWGGRRFGSRIVDSRSAHVNLPPAQAFAPIARIGGRRGWYYANALWRLRGIADLLVGGVGMRRGRRHPELIRNGDAIDFWRVESFKPNRLLRLSAEMRVPGRAWRQFEVTPEDDGRSIITQTAIFDPHGLWGLMYWYALYPLHGIIFTGMLREIVRAAESAAKAHG